MNAQPPPFTPLAAPTPGMIAGSARGDFSATLTDPMSMKWAALHDAAGVVAMLAGVAAEPMSQELRGFPVAVQQAGGWRQTMAEQGIADLAAIMEPGIAALLAVQARGVSAAVPAAALWHEFENARSVLLALTPPPNDVSPPHRFA